MSIIKDINGYEGLYKISSTGEIMSGKKQLKLGIGARGYYHVSLYKNGIKTTKCRYKLIALNFIPNPHNHPCVNHIDGNKLNDSIENLEWCSYSHNIQHAFDTGIKKPSIVWLGKFGALHSRSKPVLQQTMSGEFVKKWGSIREIQRELGFLNTGISNCLNGRSKKSYGFKWAFEN